MFRALHQEPLTCHGDKAHMELWILMMKSSILPPLTGPQGPPEHAVFFPKLTLVTIWSLEAASENATVTLGAPSNGLSPGELLPAP